MQWSGFGLSPPASRTAEKKRNKENNREFFEFDLRTLNLCPKSANFAFEQGINREFCGNLSKPASVLELAQFAPGCKKLTGNYQGISPVME